VVVGLTHTASPIVEVGRTDTKLGDFASIPQRYLMLAEWCGRPGRLRNNSGICVALMGRATTQEFAGERWLFAHVPTGAAIRVPGRTPNTFRYSVSQFVAIPVAQFVCVIITGGGVVRFVLRSVLTLLVRVPQSRLRKSSADVIRTTPKFEETM